MRKYGVRSLYEKKKSVVDRCHFHGENGMFTTPHDGVYTPEQAVSIAGDEMYVVESFGKLI